jgi:hypothetical protein
LQSLKKGGRRATAATVAATEEEVQEEGEVAKVVVVTASVRGGVEKEAVATVVAVRPRSARRPQSAHSEAKYPRQSRRVSSTVGWYF